MRCKLYHNTNEKGLSDVKVQDEFLYVGESELTRGTVKVEGKFTLSLGFSSLKSKLTT